MATRKQKIYFYRLTLESENPRTNLETLLNLYRQNRINHIEEVHEGEKETWLVEEMLNNNLLLFKYEVSNFGIRENIKERTTRTNAGIITENQYIEKYQHIILKKINKNNYNVAFQNIQSGMSYNFFLQILEQYFKLLPNINNTILINGIYYQNDFFSRVANLKTLKTLIIEGKKSNNVELGFANIKTNEYELTNKITIKAKRGVKSYLRSRGLEDFLKKEYEKYDNVKITIKGGDESGDIKNILSENIQINEDLRINLTSESKLDFLDLKNKMIDRIENLGDNGYIVLEDKKIILKNS